MPRAVSVPGETQKFDLSTLPPSGNEEGGWVELRKLTFEEILYRNDIAANIEFDFQQRRKKRGSKPQERTARIQTVQAKVTQYEFPKTIVKHNLEDDGGRLLSFASDKDFNMLNPLVGDEIQDIIYEMNGINQEAEEDGDADDPLGNNLPSSSTSPSNSLGKKGT